MTEKELDRLVSEMSLQEKIDQMLQITGGMYQSGLESALTGPMAQLGISEEHISEAGSILGTYGADALREIQTKAMEAQPHHIPMLFMLDVIHGMKTVFPIPLGLGATFDPELAFRCARAAAREAAYHGVHVVFSPMADLVRDARWGRVMESTGEDPYLNQCMTAAQVKGFQGDDMREEGNVCACVKHFAGYGAATAGRDYNTVDLPEITLRGFYLGAYRAGVDAGAGMVMTSFNTIQQIPATINRHLMRDILRNEWNFDGVLISDYSAILETVAHGAASDPRDAAAKALQAGVDIDMMSPCYSEHLAELARRGAVSERLIDESVRRILSLKNRLGLFENPFKDADAEKAEKVSLCADHRSLAREAVAESCVLLKNEGILPLNPGKKEKTAFIGPYVFSRKVLSSWAICGDTEDCVSIREAGQEVFDDSETVYCRGTQILGRDVPVQTFASPGQTPQPNDQEWDRETALRQLEEAAAAAKEADTVVLCLGESYLQSGEACSRAFLDLPEVQTELLRRVYEVNQNIVVVLFCGRPLDLREVTEKAKAVLVAWMPGTEAGHGIMDILTGAANPSGKLPMSFPYCVGQCPVYYSEFSTGRPLDAARPQRYRSRYLDVPNQPLYAFGFGMSYTEFSISPVRLSRDRIKEGESLSASVRVKNAGGREGTEVVQLYIRDVSADAVRPVRELKGFRRVTLKPSEEKTVTFTIDPELLKYTRTDWTTAWEPGEFRLWIGNSSRTENGAAFFLDA